MNPLQQLMIQKMMMGARPAAQSTVPPAPTYTPDVAQNIGQDKLAKHAYNPYNLLTLNPSTNEDKVPSSKNEQFTQEMLKDSRE